MKQSNIDYLAHEHESPERRNRRAQYTEQVNTILYLYWDPIGCGVPLDEYESYAQRIVAQGSDWRGNFGVPSAEVLQDRLMRIERFEMGLNPNGNKAWTTACILFERYGKQP